MKLGILICIVDTIAASSGNGNGSTSRVLDEKQSLAALKSSLSSDMRGHYSEASSGIVSLNEMTSSAVPTNLSALRAQESDLKVSASRADQSDEALLSAADHSKVPNSGAMSTVGALIAIFGTIFAAGIAT